MDQVQINISRNELSTLIQEAVISALNKSNSGSDEIMSEYEACLFLNVTMPMLSTLTAEGLIKIYPFRNKSLFRKGDLVKYLNSREANP